MESEDQEQENQGGPPGGGLGPGDPPRTPEPGSGNQDLPGQERQTWDRDHVENLLQRLLEAANPRTGGSNIRTNRLNGQLSILGNSLGNINDQEQQRFARQFSQGNSPDNSLFPRLQAF